MNIRNAAIRGLRTFVQAAVGAFLTTGVLSAVVDTGSVDLDALGVAGVSALAAGLIGLLSFVQNLVEDNTEVNVPK